MNEPNWEGRQLSTCGEHRTVGYRAWCHNCSEWCYPQAPCYGCNQVDVDALLAEYDALLASQLVRQGDPMAVGQALELLDRLVAIVRR